MFIFAFFQSYFVLNNRRKSYLLIKVLGVLTLSACSVGPVYQTPIFTTAPLWQTPLPQTSAQNSVTDLNNFWQQFDDPLVPELIASAQLSNPTLEQALARIEQARATLKASYAGAWPSLEANVRVNRGNNLVSSSASSSQTSVATTSTGTLDAVWELDLFGANRSARVAAEARLAARTAEWHDARISLAAEVASTIINWRTCNALLKLSGQDVLSRQQTAALTALKVQAGFTAIAEGALTQASAADGRQRHCGDSHGTRTAAQPRQRVSVPSRQLFLLPHGL